MRKMMRKIEVMRKRMRKMMRKIEVMRKTMRKMMRKIEVMRKTMRKMMRKIEVAGIYLVLENFWPLRKFEKSQSREHTATESVTLNTFC